MNIYKVTFMGTGAAWASVINIEAKHALGAMTTAFLKLPDKIRGDVESSTVTFLTRSENRIEPVTNLQRQ